ncbi:hypothetical protein [Eggerthia catenaformis]|uniref:hypothetical protein n=1 Tax=Eggerthia catenaformis TaxID=31973 RepID=UPI003C6F051A
MKGKCFGYELEHRNNSKIILKSCDINDLDIFINKLCLLFSDEKDRIIIIDTN